MSVFHEIDVEGKHILQKVNSILNHTHRGLADKARMLYDRSDDSVYYGTNTEWVKLPSLEDIFPSGTKIIMASYPLPPNFNIDYTADWNQKVIMFTSDPLTIGDTPSGALPGTSWQISGISTDGQHYHGNKTGKPTVIAVLGKSDIDNQAASKTHRHNISNDGSHSHVFDGTWRPVHTHYLVVEYTAPV